MSYYSIKKDTLDDIADAIREKTGSTDTFTPVEMAEEIKSIMVGDNLPNAEDAYFGIVQGDYEHGYGDFTFTLGWGNASESLFYGNKIRPNTAFAVYGFRHCALRAESSRTFQIWDLSTQTVLASLSTATPQSNNNEWSEYYLPSPVNLEAGKDYAVVSASTYHFHTKKNKYSPPPMNAKVTLVDKIRGRITSTSLVTDDYYGTTDFLIGPPITESVTTEYKV